MATDSSLQGDAERVHGDQTVSKRGFVRELTSVYRQVPLSTWVTSFSDRGKLRGCQAESLLHYVEACRARQPFSAVQTFPVSIVT